MDDDPEDYSAIGNAITKRGHSQIFSTIKPIEKTDVEYGVVVDWIYAVKLGLGYDLTNLKRGAEINSAPDFEAEFEGRKIRIELTELVNEKILRRINIFHKYAENNWKPETGKTSPDDMPLAPGSSEHNRLRQWDRNTLLSKLVAIIKKKAKSYEDPAVIPMDFLVIYTGEHLTLHQVTDWLHDVGFELSPKLRRVHLMLPYQPEHPSYYPLYELQPNS
jgi:hypothetical protein